MRRRPVGGRKVKRACGLTPAFPGVYNRGGERAPRLTENSVARNIPEVSVVIPCYRQAEFLPHALDSVLSQKGPRLQVIVVDDGSPDDVAGVCRRYGAAVRYVRQDNSGVSAARNAGIELAEGEFLHFLDADDAIRPGMYAAMVRALRTHPGWTAVVCGTWFADADCKPLMVGMSPPRVGCPFERLARANQFPIGAVVLRRKALERTGAFYPGQCEDWDLWLRIARTGAVFGRVKEAYFVYRILPASRSRDPIAMYESFCQMLDLAARPDPRGRDPAPQYAHGISIPDIEECLAKGAALTLGKAIGGGDVDVCLTALGVFREASITRGLLPCSCENASREWWPLLAELVAKTRDDPAASAFMGDVAACFLGAYERDEWKRRYERLARRLPVRLLLWVRRSLLGRPDP